MSNGNNVNIFIIKIITIIMIRATRALWQTKNELILTQCIQSSLRTSASIGLHTHALPCMEEWKRVRYNIRDHNSATLYFFPVRSIALRWTCGSMLTHHRPFSIRSWLTAIIGGQSSYNIQNIYTCFVVINGELLGEMYWRKIVCTDIDGR